MDYRAYPVLVVDDEPDILEIFELNYGRELSLRTAGSGTAALEIVAREPVAVLVADQRMPEMTGLEVIRRARALRPTLLPIILTGYTDVQSLVDAINLGCIRRFIPKPFDPSDLRQAIFQALEAYHLGDRNTALATENSRLVAELAQANERLKHENRWLRECADGGGFEAIVGAAPAIRRVVDLARRVLDSPTTVLIEGPTGSGKELVARAIHDEGPRARRLFVPVNVGAVPDQLLADTLFGHRRGAFTDAVADRKGLFELADGGTLFLDEIGETSPALQIHLLRVLQEGEVTPIGAGRPVRVDVRVVAATNRNLDDEVRAGRFREDLLHRLKVFPIRVPGLMERKDDIPRLAGHILERCGVRLRRPVSGFTPEAMAALQRYDFPGNVRELANLIERALLLCPTGEPIGVEDLFERVPPLRATEPADDDVLATAVARFEQERIRDMLAACGNNKTRAARRLGLTYRGLLLKMQRYGMPTGDAQRVA